MAEKAQFVDGSPANLPAAALDGLEWLEWLQKYAARAQVFSQKDSTARLGRAIKALKRELEPHLPLEHLEQHASTKDAEGASPDTLNS